MCEEALQPPPADETDDEYVRFLEYVRSHPPRAEERKARLYAAYFHRSRKPLVQFRLSTLFVMTSVIAFLMALHQVHGQLFSLIGLLFVVLPVVACIVWGPVFCLVGLIVLAAGEREVGVRMTQLGLRIIAGAVFVAFCFAVVDALPM